MATTGLLPGDLGSQIQGLLGAMQPPQSLIDAANRRAQLDFFLGMMGTPKGMEFQGIGQSGINALNARDNYIKTQQGLALQNAQLAMPLLQLSLRQQFAKQLSDAFGQAAQPTPVDTSLPAGAVGGTGMGGGTPAAFGPSSQPGPVSGPTVNVPAYNANPSTRQRLAQLSVAAKAMGLPDIAPDINLMFPPPVRVNQGGGVFNPMTGEFQMVPKLPEGTNPVQTPNGWISQSVPGALPAITAAAAAESGGRASGELPYRITEGTDASGHRVQGYAPNVFGAPPVAGATPPPQSAPAPAPVPPQPTNTAFAPQNAGEAAALRAARLYGGSWAATPQGTFPDQIVAPNAQAPAPGTLVGQSPAELEQQKANIETAAKKMQGFNATNQATATKQLEEFQNARPSAYRVLAALDQLERSDNGQVFNGPVQQVYGEAANWVNSLLGTNIDTTKITNSQTYNSALQTAVRGALKQFPGGRIFQSEFTSTLQSVPSLIVTPQGRQQIRNMLGAQALDIINQANSAERYFNPNTGLTGFTPPSPIVPQNYWTARQQITGLQPSPTLPPALQAKVLSLKTPQGIREAILNGWLTAQ